MILDHLVPYLDHQVKMYYDAIARQVEKGTSTWSENHLTPIVVYYLHTRNQTDAPLDPKSKEIFDYFVSQAEIFWQDQVLLSQVHLVSIFEKNGKDESRIKLINSLKERKLYDPDLGA